MNGYIVSFYFIYFHQLSFLLWLIFLKFYGLINLRGMIFIMHYSHQYSKRMDKDNYGTPLDLHNLIGIKLEKLLLYHLQLPYICWTCIHYHYQRTIPRDYTRSIDTYFHKLSHRGSSSTHSWWHLQEIPFYFQIII